MGETGRADGCDRPKPTRFRVRHRAVGKEVIPLKGGETVIGGLCAKEVWDDFPKTSPRRMEALELMAVVGYVEHGRCAHCRVVLVMTTLLERFFSRCTL